MLFRFHKNNPQVLSNFFAFLGTTFGGYVYYKYTMSENKALNVINISSGMYIGYILGGTYGCIFGPYLLIGGGVSCIVIKMKNYKKNSKE